MPRPMNPMLLVVVCLLLKAGPSLGDPGACMGEEREWRLSVAAGQVTNMIDDRPGGPYVDLLRRVEAETPLRFDITVFADRRAKRHFVQGQADAYLLRSNYDDELSPLQVLLGAHRLHAFVRGGTRPPSSVEGLAGMRVGLPYLYSFPSFVTENKTFEVMKLAESAQANLEALLLGRVDVAIAPLSVGQDFSSRLAPGQINVDPDSPVLVKEAYMVFRPELTCAAHIFREKVHKLRQEGRLAGILEPQNPKKITN